jgi:hypothetical protein
MSRTFVACKSTVHNRGKPPESFLNEIIDWARSAPEEIFQHNELHDIYSDVVADLGPWQSLEYCARLIRFTVNHHGPIKHKKINPWLRRDAVAEFEGFLSP